DLVGVVCKLRPSALGQSLIANLPVDFVKCRKLIPCLVGFRAERPPFAQYREPSGSFGRSACVPRNLCGFARTAKVFQEGEAGDGTNPVQRGTEMIALCMLLNGMAGAWNSTVQRDKA